MIVPTNWAKRRTSPPWMTRAAIGRYQLTRQIEKRKPSRLTVARSVLCGCPLDTATNFTHLTLVGYFPNTRAMEIVPRLSGRRNYFLVLQEGALTTCGQNSQSPWIGWNIPQIPTGRVLLAQLKLSRLSHFIGALSVASDITRVVGDAFHPQKIKKLRDFVG